MGIATREINEYVVITAQTDRLDVVNMNEMKEAMLAVVEAGSHRVVIDLSGVSFIDSSGLSSLISLLKRLNTVGGSLRLCGLQEQPRELFQITQLNKLFKIVDTCEEATA